MIQIIIIAALLQIGFNLLFKPKYNQLNCGLFGASADDITKINIDKLKILGVFNDTRGGHSCGISLDGDIMLGTYKNKLFKDFIINSEIASPVDIPIIIGHTRFATGGAHNEDNSHPFGFGEYKNNYRFIGAHNGSLLNDSELAILYNIDETAPAPTTYNKKLTRTKIDSEILLEIIYKKGFKVLEEYDGAAALSFYDTKEPDTIYLYHGKSKLYNDSTTEIEERPLFYYQASPGIFYYSSIKESLEAINDTNGVIEMFEHNRIYKIKGGNVSSAKKFIINRSKCYQKKSASKNNSTTVIDYTNKEWCSSTRKWVDKKTVETKKEEHKLNLNNLEDHKNHFEEKHMIKDQIYYENLQFLINKKPLNGIYVIDENSELQYLCNSLSIVEETYEGDDKIKKREGKPIYFYFHDGVMLRAKEDYNIIKTTNFSYSHAVDKLSYMSVYPVRSHNYSNSLAFFRGFVSTMTFTNLFTKNVIKLNTGKCVEITTKPTDFNECKKYYLPEDIKLIEELLNPSEEKDVKNDLETVSEIYNENLIATIDYCIEDVEDSLDTISEQSSMKSKLESIKKFIQDIFKV